MRHDWPYAPTEILSLPLDELALAILRDAHANNEWNYYNWLNTAVQTVASGSDRVLEVLAEGWNWLFSHGLVTEVPTRGTNAIAVTRLGKRAVMEGLEPVFAAERLSMPLHPRIEQTARRQFLMGEFEFAALAALRAVEIRVRGLGAFSDSLVGRSLMEQAFRDGGPLADPELDGGERTGVMQLFAGAIGTFKNPPSHRQVEYDDPTQAAEVVLLADLLMRMLDGVERRLGGV